MRIPINRRIAVVGTARAGKTVLMTSLINHLQHQQPGRFKIGPKGEDVLRKVQIETGMDVAERFPYESFRDGLVNKGTWPQKTTDSSTITLSMEPSHWKFRSLNLTFFDFPGERVADAEIAAYEDYGQWSDAVLKRFRMESEYSDLLSHYLRLVDKRSGDEAALIERYKVALANLILNYKPFITPSVFLLDEDGQKAKHGSADEIAAARRVGLADWGSKGGGGEFVPLSEQQRIAQIGMAERFSHAYQRYRDKLVRPLYDELLHCDRMLVLCDISELLAGGSGAYNDQRGILDQLFRVLHGQSPLTQLLASVLDVFNFHLKGFDKLAFAATKIDRIAAPDRGKALDLLRELGGKWERDVDTPVDWFGVSGIVSLQSAQSGNPYELIGVPRMDDQGQPLPSDGARAVFTVPEIEGAWPARWEPNIYRFPLVHPEVPHVHSQPPKHINLDKLFEYIAL